MDTGKLELSALGGVSHLKVSWYMYSYVCSLF